MKVTKMEIEIKARDGGEKKVRGESWFLIFLKENCLFEREKVRVK